MIKKFTFGIITLLFVSCGVDHTDFSGNWIDKKNESDRMIIKKNGDNYLIERRGKKYPAQIKDGLLEISTELPIKATIDDNDNLIIGGDEYIRFEKSEKSKIVGLWKRKKTDEVSECTVTEAIKFELDNTSLKLEFGNINNNNFNKSLSNYNDITQDNDAYTIKHLNFKNGKVIGIYNRYFIGAVDAPGTTKGYYMDNKSERYDFETKIVDNILYFTIKNKNCESTVEYEK